MSGPRHLDEASAVFMDTNDIIDPAIAAIQCLMVDRGSFSPMAAYPRSGTPKADLIIRSLSSLDNDINLLLFEHESKAVGAHLFEFSLASGLAQEHTILDYREILERRSR